MSAKVRKFVRARATSSSRACVIGLPVSAISAATNSSNRSSIRSAARRSSAVRSRTGVSAQPLSRARLAEVTARSTRALSASWTWARTRPGCGVDLVEARRLRSGSTIGAVHVVADPAVAL